MRESKTIIRGKILQDLVKTAADNYLVCRKASEVEIDLSSGEFQMCIIEMDDYEEQEPSAKRFIIKNITEEIVDKYSGGYVFELDEDKIGILFCVEKLSAYPVKHVLDEVFDCVRRYVRGSVTVAAGNRVPGCRYIHESYRNASKALEWKFFSGGNKIVYFDELNTEEYKGVANFNWNFDELQDAVRSHERTRITNGIDGIFKEAVAKKLPIKVIYSIVTGIFIKLADLINGIGGNIDDVLGEEYYYENIHEKQTIHELSSLLTNACLEISSYMKNAENNRSNRTVEGIMKYVDERYYEDISLTTISKMYFMSPVYLGRLFKNTVGVNFTEYVNNCRVEHAARMLEEDEGLMVYEISDKVGYKDINYFYRIFKNKKGITPSEYRMMNSRSKT